MGVNIVYPFSHPPASLSSSILQLVFLMSCFIPLDAWEEFSFLLLYCNIELYAVWRPSYQNNLSQNLIESMLYPLLIKEDPIFLEEVCTARKSCSNKLPLTRLPFKMSQFLIECVVFFWLVHKIAIVCMEKNMYMYKQTNHRKNLVFLKTSTYLLVS